MITSVFYRATESESDYGGNNSHSWFGEDSIRINDTVFGKAVNKIQYGTVRDNFVVEIWGSSSLIMTIPWNSVCRIIHD